MSSSPTGTTSKPSGFATPLATFARNFVRAMPTVMGIPTRPRISSRSRAAISGRRAGDPPQAADVEERLVDREPLHERRRVPEDLEHRLARFRVHLHAGPHDDRLGTEAASLHLAHRCPHAGGLGFVAGGEHDPAAHDHGAAAERRVITLLDRGVERVGVRVEDRAFVGHLVMLAVATDTDPAVRRRRRRYAPASTPSSASADRPGTAPWRMRAKTDRLRVGGVRPARPLARPDPRVPTTRWRARRATAAWSALAPACRVGGLAGQHAPSRPPVDPCTGRGDRTHHLGGSSLVQIWGPRFSAYVVAARDRAAFSLGRMPDDAKGRGEAEGLAARLRAHLGDEAMAYGDAGRALGEPPNRLRYAAPTGTLLIRWDGARQPTVWTVPPPEVDPRDARLELARRFVHVFGPTTAEAFAPWAGISARAGVAAFDALRGSLSPARTPIGDAWILTRDEPMFRSAPGAVAPARLLPSGDAFFLLQGADRELLVPDPGRRAELWTPRVWPGALLVEGEVAGTWRRADRTVTIRAWARLSNAARDAVETEAASLPLPGVRGGSSSAGSDAAMLRRLSFPTPGNHRRWLRTPRARGAARPACPSRSCGA